MTTMTAITKHDIPASLNGYPVVYHSIRKDGQQALVILHRPKSFQPWVAATWWPELGDTWQWGHYFNTFEEVARYRAKWLRTYR